MLIMKIYFNSILYKICFIKIKFKWVVKSVDPFPKKHSLHLTLASDKLTPLHASFI